MSVDHRFVAHPESTATSAYVAVVFLESEADRLLRLSNKYADAASVCFEAGQWAQARLIARLADDFANLRSGSPLLPSPCANSEGENAQ